MQALKNITAVFCLACVCAEVLVRLTAKGWPRRGIKAAAGLYILVSLMYALPQAKAELGAFSAPRLETGAFGTAEEAVLAQAERQLEQTAAAQCLEETGVKVRLKITLEQSGEEVSAKEATAEFGPEVSEVDRARAADFLRGLLGAEIRMVGEGGT